MLPKTIIGLEVKAYTADMIELLRLFMALFLCFPSPRLQLCSTYGLTLIK